MSALRKPKPTSYAATQAILTEAEKAFWRAWVKSLNLKPMGVHEPVNPDHDPFKAWGVADHARR